MKEIDQLGDHFIGLWAYRYKEIKYCATIVYGNRHYDTRDYKLPERALEEAIKLLKKLNGRKSTS